MNRGPTTTGAWGMNLHASTPSKHPASCATRTGASPCRRCVPPTGIAALAGAEAEHHRAARHVRVKVADGGDWASLVQPVERALLPLRRQCMTALLPWPGMSWLLSCYSGHRRPHPTTPPSWWHKLMVPFTLLDPDGARGGGWEAWSGKSPVRGSGRSMVRRQPTPCADPCFGV